MFVCVKGWLDGHPLPSLRGNQHGRGSWGVQMIDTMGGGYDGGGAGCFQVPVTWTEYE